MRPVDDALDQALSAVMDGQASPADWARVNAAWANDPALRERWVLWQTAADGLRSPDVDLPGRDPEALLAALRAQLPAAGALPLRRREWLAPLAVAAGFVAVAVGIGALRPPAAVGPTLTASAPPATPRAQGLGGLSFAQTAAGRTLPGDAPPEVIDWPLTLTEAAASAPPP